MENVEGKNKINCCVPVNFTVLGIVHLSQDAVKILNMEVSQVVDNGETIMTTISDYRTMECPRVVHKVFTDME